MRDLFLNYRKLIIGTFIVLTVVAAIFAMRLKFTFSFEQFFPEGDEDLAFFLDFVEEFETDDNFLLVAVENQEGVFDSSFLERFHQFSVDCKGLPFVEASMSLTQTKMPLKTPFGLTTVPIIHRNSPDKYAQDKKNLLEDELFRGFLINESATSMIVSIKTIESIGLEDSEELINKLYGLLDAYGFEDYHLLGRAYFSKELVEMQLKEIVLSSVVSIFLVFIIMLLIFRKPIGVFIGLTSIGMGLFIFLGLMGILGRELNIMSALYPILMLIVGTSDVIHIMSKYIDELKKGLTRDDAIIITIKEIGLATLLTSLTTAIGFVSLLSSRIYPIRDFGINAAMGVIVAYIVVVLFTTACLSLCKKEQLIKESSGESKWTKWMQSAYLSTINHKKRILFLSFIITVLSVYGMSIITTNYRIEGNLPRKGKVTEDFKYFEKEYGGFRPLEFAILAQGQNTVDSYAVQKEIDKLENKIRETEYVGSIVSPTMIQKSIQRMNGRNQLSAYTFPSTERQFDKNQRMAEKLPTYSNNILISQDKTKARLSSKVQDIGADRITELGKSLDKWVAGNIDTSLIHVKRTGTGIIVDKNAQYVRESLVYGLGIALIIISFLMGFLFRNVRMLFISLVPNLLPLIFAAGLMGYLQVEMEAGIAIVFAIVFGIAVDDTIHFLSKYNLALRSGKTNEQALEITFRETGKAICLTSVILFFGFMIMLFSNNPPSVNIGVLISITLVSAVACDLFLLPILLRRFMK